MTDAPTIFISYSHKDEKPWKNFVQTHLEVVARQDGFLIWEDRRIRGGDDWRDKINTALEQADIAVLLISPYFLTSDFILNHEVKELLKWKEQQGLRIYPILIIDCAWKSVDWLERLNLRPTDGRALASFQGNNRHKVMSGMVEEIGHILREEDLQAKAIAELEQQKGELARRLGVTEDAIQSFLDILDQRHVDSADLKAKLEEIAAQYREMQERLAALDQDDPVIKDWIDQAKAAIDDGNYDEADELLILAEERDLSAARQAAAQADQRFLNAAATRAIRGGSSLTRMRYLEAAEHFAEAADIVPASRPKIKASYLTQQGDALTRGSRTQAAIEAYEQAAALNADSSAFWLSFSRLHLQAGDLSAAEEAAKEAQSAATRESNKRHQAIASHEIGWIRVQEGKLDGALEAFHEYQAIIESLAADDPGNSELQRDLSVSHDKIGDVRRAQGDLAGALSAYEASLAIAERLASADPGNAGWQRDLIVSRWKLADLAEQGYESEEALDHWQAALVIAKELEESGRLAPTDDYVVETIEQRINALIEPAAGPDG